MLTRTYRFILGTCTRFRLRNKREGKRPINCLVDYFRFAGNSNASAGVVRSVGYHTAIRASRVPDGTLAGPCSRVGPVISQASDRPTESNCAPISFVGDRFYQSHINGHIMKRFDSQRFDIQKFDKFQFSNSVHSRDRLVN
ncbi:unnamed protein product [Cercospora beticola]|nr:unnamed protein product [Cercospora beticola]